MEVVLRGKNNYSARGTDTSLGTIRSLKTTARLAKSVNQKAQISLRIAELCDAVSATHSWPKTLASSIRSLHDLNVRAALRPHRVKWPGDYRRGVYGILGRKKGQPLTAHQMLARKGRPGCEQGEVDLVRNR